jgi:catechol 2,3-dioxygenase-like lactoylglutathione lyase family enzyme
VRKQGRYRYYQRPAGLTEFRDWLGHLERFWQQRLGGWAIICGRHRGDGRDRPDRPLSAPHPIRHEEFTMALTNLQVVSVPVSDQDRAKQFYVGQLGFAEEIDASFGDSMRWVMLRPPGSGTAVTLVTWFRSMPAGSMRGAVLGCDDISTTLAELSSRGVTFNEDEIQDAPWGRWKTFEDPDGNGWVLQQDNPGFRA